MNARRRIRWACSYAAIAMLLPASTRADSVDSTIEVLDAAVEKWRHEVEFRSHFTFRQGIATSKAEGLEGKFGSRIGNSEDKATGMFHKLGSRLRQSLDFGREPDDATLGKTGGVYANVSSDRMSTDRLGLDYLPKYGNFGDSVNIYRRPDNDSGLLKAGMGGDGFDPFAFGGGVQGHPLTSFKARPGFQETIEKSVARSDPEHIEVTMIRRGKGNSEQIHRVLFSTVHSPPVIEKVEDVGKDSRGHPPIEVVSVAVASDFVKCGGGMMARRLRRVGGPLKPSDQAKRVWVVQEWFSDDLGERLPTDEDFVVTIPPSTHVIGLKSPPPKGKERKFDLAKIRLDDVW